MLLHPDRELVSGTSAGIPLAVYVPVDVLECAPPPHGDVVEYRMIGAERFSWH